MTDMHVIYFLSPVCPSCHPRMKRLLNEGRRLAETRGAKLIVLRPGNRLYGQILRSQACTAPLFYELADEGTEQERIDNGRTL